MNLMLGSHANLLIITNKVTNLHVNFLLITTSESHRADLQIIKIK